MRIVLGLSGGVDSAVAGYLLKQQGHEVIGVFMKNWEDDDDEQYCSSREDFLAAAACADVLGIELQHINFAQAYKDRVFCHFLQELREGRTPNPDILCNSEIKYQAFLSTAKTLSADGVATGHYAKKLLRAPSHGKSERTHHLMVSADAHKDQTYFLYHLFPEQLARAHFPLGDFTKNQVRAIARQALIPSAERKDSTGICFIGERPFREFLSRYLPIHIGDIVDERGIKIGEHQGLAFYTLGQRQGLKIGGVKGASEAPWFVCEKDLANNRLIAVQGHQHPRLYRLEVRAGNCHWLAGNRADAAINVGMRLRAKIRYRQNASACAITALDEQNLTVRFDSPQWAVTPGQSLVLYRTTAEGEECLGGGIIQL